MLLLPVLLVACGSPDRKVVVVQPTPAPSVVAAPPPAVVVAPPPAGAVGHAVVSSYGGAVHMRPDPQSAVVTRLPLAFRWRSSEPQMAKPGNMSWPTTA